MLACSRTVSYICQARATSQLLKSTSSMEQSVRPCDATKLCLQGKVAATKVYLPDKDGVAASKPGAKLAAHGHGQACPDTCLSLLKQPAPPCIFAGQDQGGSLAVLKQKVCSCVIT